jgi:hypothetical protein
VKTYNEGNPEMQGYALWIRLGFLKTTELPRLTPDCKNVLESKVSRRGYLKTAQKLLSRKPRPLACDIIPIRNKSQLLKSSLRHAVWT